MRSLIGFEVKTESVDLIWLRNMGEAREGRSQRDLLQRFVSPEKSEVVVGGGEGSDEVELSLGLSLGGRFGVDKSSKRLVRSSSVAGSIPPAGTPAMHRTASLPVETEEQWRKRKELQSLRRMEAKRRRLEKQRSSTAAARDGVAAGELDSSAGFDLREKQHFATSNRFGSTAAPQFGIPSWAAEAAGRSVAGRLVPPSSSHGSPESRGGSSSGNSEPESKAARGSSSYDEARSPVSGNQDYARASCTNLRSPKPEIGIGATGDMPSVFTKGDGPDGRRVDGILYKYGKGEEVRIMCVCHGSFLSPADFVKHAGGGEAANPLRRIVINPSASSSL